MAEILEGPKEWSRDVRCAYYDCNTLFRVKGEDVKKYVGIDNDVSYFAACPSCDFHVRLENLPCIIEGLAREDK